MTRTVLYQICYTSKPEDALKVNLNHEIGLDNFLDYTLAEHLEDLASDGIRLISVVGSAHAFSDGSTRVFEEVIERVPLASLDTATYLLVLGFPLTSTGLEEAAGYR